MDHPILSVRDLRTYFHPDEGVVRAVDGASFDVHAGRTLGIVGESGCGKSVCARSILRIVERPGRIESGQVLLRRDDGETIDLVPLDPDGEQMRAVRGGEIALVFQEPMTSFSTYHTIGNQIVEAIRLHRPMGRKEAREHAIEQLRLVGIPQPQRRIDEYSFQLSGGLRQRVMVAMALSSAGANHNADGFAPDHTHSASHQRCCVCRGHCRGMARSRALNLARQGK